MKNIIAKFIPLLVTVVLFSACDKNNTSLNGAGKTIVKLYNPAGNPNVMAFSYKPGWQNLMLLSVRRDVPNNTELNKECVITITNTQQYLDEYNTENGTSFELLPSGYYQILPNPRLTINGDTWTVKLAPGEFATEILAQVDATTFDLAKSYAFGFKITNSTLGELHNDLKEEIVNVVIKNQWHGDYHSTGVFHHPTAGDRDIDRDKELITVGPSSVKTELGDLGGSGYFMVLTVNMDNTVTITKSGVTPNIDQSWGPNFYDPVTKTFTLNYSYNTSAPRRIEEKLELK